MSTLEFFATGDSWIDKAGLDGTDLVTGIAQIASSGRAVTTEIGTRVTGSIDNMQELNEVARLSAYQHEYGKVEFEHDGDSESAEFGAEVVTMDLGEANVISSALLGANGKRTGYHTIALDIDHPVRVVPSTTPGHYHLYIDLPLHWNDYEDLLSRLAEVGVIQQGYYDASKARGHTTLRLPWVKKSAKPEVNA